MINLTQPYAPDPAPMQGYAQPQYAAPPAPQAPQQYAQPPVPQAPPSPVPPGAVHAPAAYGYPPQQGAYPVAPPAPQPMGYGYPPQQGGGYPMQYAPPAPQPPAHTASLGSFYKQPSVGGGASWQFNQQTPVGTRYVGMVARKLTDADVEVQTGPSSIPNQPGPVLTYKDGRVKEVMKVPMLVAPDQRYPEGRAQFYVQGATRDELARAMTAAGAPDGPPEDGAVIIATKTSEYRNNYGTMSARIGIEYYRPGPQTDQYALSLGITPGRAHETPGPVLSTPQQAPPAPPQQAAPPPAPPQAAPVQIPAPQYAAQQARAAQQDQVAAQQLPPPPPAGPAPTALPADQQAVLAGLLGQPQS